MLSSARFSVGQLIHHRRFDYRGVIFDVDPIVRLGDEWYEQVATSQPPRDKPWYHVLVDGGGQVTYVAERNLEPDPSAAPISHPLLDRFFDTFRDGRYAPSRSLN